MMTALETTDRFLVRHCLAKAMKYRPDIEEQWIDQFWHQPDELIDRGVRLTDKRCVRTTVRVTMDVGAFVVKRYLERSWRHQTKRLFCRSRAEKCWQDTWYLVDHGYRTPQPVAYLENRLGPLRGSSYYVYQFVEGKTLKQLATGLKNQRLLRHYVSELAEIWKVQALLGVNLTDGHPDNFIVDASGSLWVIDLDKLQFVNNRSPLRFRYLESSFMETVKGVIGDRFVIRYARQSIHRVLKELERQSMAEPAVHESRPRWMRKTA